MSEERFFSKANVHRAVWSILLALLAFVGGVVFSRLRGKEKVVIATPEEGGKPVVVRIEGSTAQPDLQTLATIDGLRREVERLRTEQRQVRPTPKRTQSSVEAPRTNASTIRPPFLPPFEMPSAVEGYTIAGLSAFGEASCPPDTVNRGDAVVLQLFVEGSIKVDELTPAYLRISRSEGEHRSVRLIEQQYVLVSGLSSFRVPIDLPPGEYQVALGFYARSELARKYPNFYSVQCALRVQ